MDITDAVMKAKLETARAYTTVLLKKGPAYQPPATRSPEDAQKVWEHGRRNMQLQSDGKKALVGPVLGGGDLVGISVFTVDADEARVLMDADGAVQAGIFVYELVTWLGFPGDGLPSA